MGEEGKMEQGPFANFLFCFPLLLITVSPELYSLIYSLLMY